MKARPRLVIFALTVIAIFTMIAFFAKDVQENMTLGLDLQGGFEIVYEVSPLDDGGELPSMAAVARSVSKRIDVLGVSEPEIVIEGEQSDSRTVSRCFRSGAGAPYHFRYRKFDVPRC
jgi:preprotein translocase subunit SecD